VRRLFCFILCICLLAVCVLPVWALSSATAQVHASVSGSGECQVVITATIHLDAPAGDLTFPIPRDAHSVKLDGSRARTQKTDSALLVDLSGKAGNMTGDLPVTITYSLSDVVVQTETGPQVQIPLLSGFRYPIDTFDFSVTLPGQVTAKPAFSGGYQLAGIEKNLHWDVSGPEISGYSLSGLMDNETLLFTLDVPEDMFPRSAFLTPDLVVGYTGMAVCGALALLYWLLTMGCLPPRRLRETTPPDGCGAGQLRSLLTLEGADLTMMIFSWAQLGYVTLQQGPKGHILVSKQMDMGNERNPLELRCFQKLFRSTTTVDTASRQYALLRQKAAMVSPELDAYVRPRNGNPRLFRILSALIAMFCCGCLGISLSSGAILQWLLAILLSALGFFMGWYIQNWAAALFSVYKKPLRTALILCGVLLLIGLLAGQPGLALLGILSQLLAGFLGQFGGRRTDSGKQAMGQVLALRRHLRTLSPSQLKTITESNPDYLQSVTPYILALGLDRQLARRMARTSLPVPGYLPASAETLPAPKWSHLLRSTVFRMDAGYRRLSGEQTRRFLSQILPKFK